MSENGIQDEMIGQFRLVSKIGEGGMGEVYRATDFCLLANRMQAAHRSHG